MCHFFKSQALVAARYPWRSWGPRTFSTVLNSSGYESTDKKNPRSIGWVQQLQISPQRATRKYVYLCRDTRKSYSVMGPNFRNAASLRQSTKLNLYAKLQTHTSTKKVKAKTHHRNMCVFISSFWNVLVRKTTSWRPLTLVYCISYHRIL